MTVPSRSVSPPLDAPPLSFAGRLVRLLTTRERLPSDFCAGWDAAAWEMVLTRLGQHRLKPLLHWRLTNEHAHVAVPAAVSEVLKQSFRKATLRSLTLQGDLRDVHRILQAAQIPHLTLKGAFLAQHVYPHPALRPMRDLDVLVPMAALMPAWAALLKNGCTRSPHHEGQPEAFMDDGGKHLPPILAPSGRSLLEVHGRIVSADEVGQAAADSLDEAAVWSRRISVPEGAETFDYMSPTDLLLHLIVHAAYDHRFDNGPLVLSDVAFLLERQVIDWPLFWALAANSGWTRGCQLLLRIVDRYCGVPPGARIDPGGEDQVAGLALDALVETTVELMFRDGSSPINEETLGAIDDADGVLGRVRFLMRKAFPPRRLIAAQFPVDPDSPAVLIGYVRRWWYVTRRALALRRGLRDASLEDRRTRRCERRQLESLDRWLKGK